MLGNDNWGNEEIKYRKEGKYQIKYGGKEANSTAKLMGC